VTSGKGIAGARGLNPNETRAVQQADAAVGLDTTAPRLWRGLVNQLQLVERVARGVDRIAGRYAHRDDRVRTLLDTGIDGSDSLYAHACACIHGYDSEPDRERSQDILPYTDGDGYGYHGRVLYAYGAGSKSPLGIRLPFADLVDGPLAVLRETDTVPTIVFHLTDAFEADLIASQRRAVCRLLKHLATTFDVAVIGTGRCRRKLAAKYRAELGPRVSEAITATPGETQTTDSIEQRIAEATDAFDSDGMPVAILRRVCANAPAATTYNEVYAMNSDDESTDRVRIGKLEEHGLVWTGPTSHGSKSIEALPAGTAFIERLDKEAALQKDLETYVSETGKRSDDSRVDRECPRGRATEAANAPPATGGGGGEDGAGEIVTDSAMVGWNATAVASSAPENGIGFVDHPIESLPDPRSRDRLWRYDSMGEGPGRLTVGAECIGPMQYGVCLAFALTSPWTFEHALTADRLDGNTDDVDAMIGDLLQESPGVLRDMTCIGYLKDADATGEAYIGVLLEEREHLSDLLTRWDNNDYDCSDDEFRGTVLRTAHGLAGTVAHLCALCGIELCRELRMPTFSRSIKSKSSLRSDIAETVAKHVSIQSRYGLYAAHRQLCEQREDKRRGAGRPAVDASDPYGEFIGSLTIVGPGVTDLESDLNAALSGMDTHEDAPEFAVPVEIEDVTDSRSATAQALLGMADRNEKTLSWESLQQYAGYLTDLLGSPYDVAKALNRLDSDDGAGKGAGMETETETGARTDGEEGDLRDDELRYAIGTLPPRRVVPAEGKPALSKLVHALAVSGEHVPHTDRELADLAGISTRSVRKHIETAEAMAFAERHEVRRPADGSLVGVWFSAARPTYDTVPVTAAWQIVVTTGLLPAGGPDSPEVDPPPTPSVAASIGDRPIQQSVLPEANS
jgi:hypothetical protein